MKRAGLLVGLIFAAFASVSYLFGTVAVLFIGIVLLLIIVFFFTFRKSFGVSLKTFVLITLCMLFCGYLVLHNFVVIKPTERLAGQTKTAVLRVIDEPKFDDGYVELLVVADSLDGQRRILSKPKLKLFIDLEQSASGADVGDILSANLTFKETDERYRKYGFSEGIYVSANCEDAEIIGNRFSFYGVCVNIRRLVKNAINKNFSGDEAALLCGLLLGDTSGMSNKVYSDFKATGLNHITSVSGMHISVLCAMLVTALGTVLSRRKAALVSFIPLVMIVAVTGMSLPAIRAGIMCAVMLFGRLSHRRGDGLNSLGVAVALILMVNPYSICDLGFQLSCAATAGVIVFSKYANTLYYRFVKINNHYVDKVLNVAVILIMQSAGAMLFTLPFIIIELGFISLTSPLASLLVCAAAAYVLVLAVIAIILFYIPLFEYIAPVFIYAVGLLLKYILIVVSAVAKIPFSYISCGKGILILWVGLSFFVVGLWIVLNKFGGMRFVATLITALLLVTLWADYLFSENKLCVSALSVDGGFCTVISFKNKGVIIGCGDDRADFYALREYLKYHGITEIDAVVLPDNTDDLTGGYRKTVTELNPKIVILAEKNEAMLLPNNSEYLLASDQDDFRFLDGALECKLMATKGGYVLLCNIFDKSFIIGTSSYDITTFDNGDFSFVLTYKAIPLLNKASTKIVHGKPELSNIEQKRLGLGEIICTDKEVTVKIIKEKGLLIYGG